MTTEWCRCALPTTALKVCHCRACCRTFTSVSSFDVHRIGGKCCDPETLKVTRGDRKGDPRLALDDSKKYPCWMTYATDRHPYRATSRA